MSVISILVFELATVHLCLALPGVHYLFAVDCQVVVEVGDLGVVWRLWLLLLAAAVHVEVASSLVRLFVLQLPVRLCSERILWYEQSNVPGAYCLQCWRLPIESSVVPFVPLLS